MFQLFRSLVYFILLSVQKVSFIGERQNKINKRAKKLKNYASNFADGKRGFRGLSLRTSAQNREKLTPPLVRADTP